MYFSCPSLATKTIIFEKQKKSKVIEMEDVRGMMIFSDLVAVSSVIIVSQDLMLMTGKRKVRGKELPKMMKEPKRKVLGISFSSS